MRYREEGDSGLLVMWPPSADPAMASRAAALRRRLEAASPPWLRDAIPGACTLSITFDPLKAGPDEVRQLVQALGDAPEEPSETRLVEIPVVYGGGDGPDLEHVAEHTGLTPEEVIRKHAAGKYRVAFMGFTPGFSYITGLPPELVMPRVKTPRTRVAPGSVGIAGEHTGIYPNDTAGGWNLIGRTATRLVDWARPDPFLLKPGDRVAFKAVNAHAFDIPNPESSVLVSPFPVLEIRIAGLMTTVQDLGRGGHAHLGVPVSGAMDRLALRLANLAAGNKEDAPALEFTFPAPRIRFLKAASFVLGGADFVATLAGRPVPAFERVDAKAGEDLSFERRRAGHWGYLALAGGIATRRFLGSAATDTRSNLGRRLGAGMKLSLDAEPATSGRPIPRDAAPMPADEPVVRFVAGENPEADRLHDAVITLSTLQDRAGYRTESPTFAPGEASMLSEGIPPGTIQLPADGKPIFLMQDRPTTGGYPKLGFFATIDTRVIAQCPPGTKIRFSRIAAEEARKLIRDARQMVDEVGGA